MIKAFFGAVVALTLWTLVPAQAAPPHPRTSQPRPRATHTPAPAAEELYSLRARRRFAAYLRLRLLEWREEGLERAAAVVEHRLPVDALVPGH